MNNKKMAFLLALMFVAMIVPGSYGGNETGLATLTVRVFLPYYDDDQHGGYTLKIAGPAPAGVIINVNDIEVGTTGNDGTLTIQVPAGDFCVDARRYFGEWSGWGEWDVLDGNLWGSACISLEAGKHGQVDIILDEGKEIAENSTLVIDQLHGGVLDRDFDSLTLRFISHIGDAVVLEDIAWIWLEDPRYGTHTDADHLFTLSPEGTLILNDAAAFRRLLYGRRGKILLRVRAGESRDNRIHDQTLEFYVGSYKIAGESPDMSSTSGFFCIPKNCLA